jgi:hypothetical protein
VKATKYIGQNVGAPLWPTYHYLSTALRTFAGICLLRRLMRKTRPIVMWLDSALAGGLREGHIARPQNSQLHVDKTLVRTGCWGRATVTAGIVAINGSKLRPCEACAD